MYLFGLKLMYNTLTQTLYLFDLYENMTRRRLSILSRLPYSIPNTNFDDQCNLNLFNNAFLSNTIIKGLRGVSQLRQGVPRHPVERGGPVQGAHSDTANWHEYQSLPDKLKEAIGETLKKYFRAPPYSTSTTAAFSRSCRSSLRPRSASWASANCGPRRSRRASSSSRTSASQSASAARSSARWSPSSPLVSDGRLPRSPSSTTKNCSFKRTFQ